MEFENLLTLINAVSDSELTEFYYEENGTNIRFVKDTMQQESKVVVPVQADSVQTIQMTDRISASKNQDNEAVLNGNIVKSPLVGTFYAAPSEDAEPFVTEGSAVKKGQTLGIVEAMKLMNEIESEFEGTVEKIFVKNGQMVEFGQPLFSIK